MKKKGEKALELLRAKFESYTKQTEQQDVESEKYVSDCAKVAAECDTIKQENERISRILVFILVLNR